jgi:hypothetical protein
MPCTCTNCGQEMEPGEDGRRPSMCPNVSIFMDVWLTDTLTGLTFEADANPIHCTDLHAHHAEIARQEYEDDNAEWENQYEP